MIFISNNQFFSQNNRFDFLLFLVTSFYCTLRYIKITFSESRYYSLKVVIYEIFIILLIATQFLFSHVLKFYKSIYYVECEHVAVIMSKTIH